MSRFNALGEMMPSMFLYTTMNPAQRNLLYNKEGLPASPFRTDRWEGVTTGKR